MGSGVYVEKVPPYRPPPFVLSRRRAQRDGFLGFGPVCQRGTVCTSLRHSTPDLNSPVVGDCLERGKGHLTQSHA